MQGSHRSIQRSLVQVIILIPLLIGLVFIIAFSTTRDLSRGQSRFASMMNRLQTNAELITSLDAVNTSSVSRNRITPEYNQLRVEIMDSIHRLESIIPDADEPRFYFRTLQAMIEHYYSESDCLLNEDLNPAEVFQTRAFLRNLHPYMLRHAQQLALTVMSIETDRQTIHIDSANRSMLQSFLLILLVEIIGMVLIFFLIRRIYGTIHHVAEYAGGLARRQWDLPDLKHYGYSDMRPIVDAFNAMKHSISTHISEIEEKHRLEAALNQKSLELLEQGKLLRESQLFALQSQMNPHFLFNTLNVIAKTALAQRPNETVELIQAMSEILRFNLQNIRRMVTLEEELNTVRAYILIQKRRFAEELEIDLEIDPAVPINTPVPPMIIQPLLENAILHGLDGKLFNRKAKIQVKLENEYVVVVTEDNGQGIRPKHVKELLTAARSSRPEREKMGIASVIRRVDLAYQGRGRVSIESDPGVFTRVSISVPIPALQEAQPRV
ncbi:sensor histidine kinase [Marispirochaeta sp.]|jgi:two-component system, sensor histidine kinase YesM|uniref:sensor histidine kinase n=1 Tax=Marispirochaeta sp. TaxID=2038653 RepID=UPI0029C9677C|nr:sensor histidine kinase [Marispirochaeta sp.]